MFIKLFVSEIAEDAEAEANRWLQHNSWARLLKTEVNVSISYFPPNVGAQRPVEQRVALTIWCEDARLDAN
jgi:hypothetical protein